MTDDTPTERFDINDPGTPGQPVQPGQPVSPTEPLAPLPPDGSEPTMLLPAADTTAATTLGTTPPGPHDPEKKSRTLLWVLIGIGGALLIAIIILLITLFANGSNPTPVATETASATPTPTASETPTPTPTPTETEAPPPSTGPTFDIFTAPASAGCEAGDDTQKPLVFQWSSSNAVRAYIGVHTYNAKEAPYESDLPPVDTYENIAYNCTMESEYYTVTLEDASGALNNKTVTISK